MNFNILATCNNVETDNTTVLDNRLDTCVVVSVDIETNGILKLFSLNVGPQCAHNKSFVIVSLHFGNTTSETTCDHKIGLVASNGTECAGWKVCEVSARMLALPGNRNSFVKILNLLKNKSGTFKVRKS